MSLAEAWHWLLDCSGYDEADVVIESRHAELIESVDPRWLSSLRISRARWAWREHMRAVDAFRAGQRAALSSGAYGVCPRCGRHGDLEGTAEVCKPEAPGGRTVYRERLECDCGATWREEFVHRGAVQDRTH